MCRWFQGRWLTPLVFTCSVISMFEAFACESFYLYFYVFCRYRALFKETKVAKTCGVNRLELVVRLIAHNPELEQFEVELLLERFFIYFLEPFATTLGLSNAAVAMYCYLRHRLHPLHRHVVKKQTIMVSFNGF